MKMCRSAGTLNSFGEELLEVSKKRNIAAHGSGALPAQALVDSKNYVYNKTYTRELKNLLIRFLQLKNDNCCLSQLRKCYKYYGSGGRHID